MFRIFNCEENAGYELELDDLIARITSYNTVGEKEPELLKAFAVMARTELSRRTFIYGGKGCENHKGFDVCNEPGHCLEYGFTEVDVPDAVYEAVSATEGEIIIFEGRPIKPFYHYRCGGATENSENVLGNRITYLRRVLCSFCEADNDMDNEKYFTVDQLEELLKTRFIKPEGVYYNIQGMFEDIEVDDQGKISRIRIGSKTYRGTEVRELLQLNSTRFDYIPIKFLVKCIGTGHGLGLCLCGAREMAKSGKSYRDILKYYYTGVSFEKMKTPDSEKPLKGLRIVLDAAHGGENCSDNRGASGLREKGVNLDIVLRLGRMLEEQGAEIHLTRVGDTAIALSDRAAFSNSIRPELFLSIGQNSFPNSTASGTELYYYRGDVQGERLSRLILERLEQDLGLKARGARTAEFYLLREVKASAVILQLLYISSPQDEALLSDAGFRENAAKSIFEGIRKYYNELGNGCT